MKSRLAALALVLTFAVLLGSLASGCKRIEQAVEPKPRIITKEATVAVAAAPVSGELPKGAPDTIPLWPGSTVTGGEVSDGTVSITLETTATYKDVVAGTSVGFKRAGWDVAEAGEEASATILNVTGEGYDGVLTLTDADGKVTLDYFLTQSAAN